MQGTELEQCVNSSVCLPQKPKLVVGLRGSTANIFAGNVAYRDFLFNTFQVSSVDMESAAVVMTSKSNGYPVIVIRGLSDGAGGLPGQNSIDIFGPLAAVNAAKAVIQFLNQTMARAQAIPCLMGVLVLNLLISSLVFPLSATPLKRRKSLNTIRYLNRKGPYLGLITVYPPEEKAFFATKAFKLDPIHPFVDLTGRRFRVGKLHGKKVIYVRCGVGMMNAAATTQQMLDLFDIAGIVHFGIAGNVNNSMSIGDVTIPKQFAHTGIWDWLKLNGTLGTNDVADLNIGSYNGMELEQCVNSSVCLPQKPKLVVGLRGSTANIFVDNAAYRDFLFNTFQVSSVDMESAAVVMTSKSNGYPVIVIRGLSDLAGGQQRQNSIDIFGPLAALNAAKAVIQFVKNYHKMPSQF
ncbi:hypothetical protein HYC85_014012 [Camellia sinensis]|uniref:Nucleoside phosphorylase domain-containing protein n=1 Tax=Camellia sinensis TaxID=4442 RepID=A0A7J7H6B9_CAMSI|nr:hypothetical protein HYC85_014012 [Camellia sinensis]